MNLSTVFAKMTMLILIMLLGYLCARIGIPVLLAACPTAMLVTALCLQYDRSDAFASKCIFINTILSAATIPLVIWLLF